MKITAVWRWHPLYQLIFFFFVTLIGCLFVWEYFALSVQQDHQQLRKKNFLLSEEIGQLDSKLTLTTQDREVKVVSAVSFSEAFSLFLERLRQLELTYLHLVPEKNNHEEHASPQRMTLTAKGSFKVMQKLLLLIEEERQIDIQEFELRQEDGVLTWQGHLAFRAYKERGEGK